jgi:NADH-quinone oxidoreductase subunit E
MAFSLKPETLARIDATIPRYPQKRSALMMILHDIQAEHHEITHEAIEWVAARLDLQPINVLEVVTFFPSYRQEKIGRVWVRVCRTLSCALNGTYQTGEILERELNCKMGHTSNDGSVTLEYAECLAACGTGPVALVDDDLFENLTPDKLGPVIAEIKKRAAGGVPTPTKG